MTLETVVTIVVLTLGWSLVARPVTTLGISGPLVFLAAGAVLDRFGAVDLQIDSGTVEVIVNVTLGLALFSDASTVDLADLRRDKALPSRLLLVGLPLTIVAGAATGHALLPALSWPAAFLLSASLAATDASLSSGVLADERVPRRIRETLNLESGLNDGLATPVVIASIAATATYLGMPGDAHGLATFVAELAGGVLIGVVAGAVGGCLITLSHRRNWTERGGRRIASLAVALLAFGAAELTGASPFIAAFLAGLAFGAVTPRTGDTDLAELPEYSSEVMGWVTWFIFGAALLIPSLDGITWRVAVYSVLSLTVIRMVPVAISLIGSRTDRASTAFIGWFGPRGLASVVFGLIIVEDLGTSDPSIRTVISTISLTILLSVIVHGLTASPLTSRLARPAAAQPGAGRSATASTGSSEGSRPPHASD